AVRIAPGHYKAQTYESLLQQKVTEIVRNNGAPGIGRAAIDMGSLMNAGKRFVLNDQQPEAIIYCSFAEFSSDTTTSKKTEYETKKVGEKEEWDEKKQKMKKKDVYDTVAVEYLYKTLTGSVEVKLDVRNTVTDESIGTKTVSSKYSKEFKETVKAPTEKEMM